MLLVEGMVMGFPSGSRLYNSAISNCPPSHIFYIVVNTHLTQRDGCRPGSGLCFFRLPVAGGIR